MNIVFMGTPEFAVPSLRQLLDDGHVIQAVVTGPEKKRGRGQRITDTPVGESARSLNLPILRPDSLSDKAFHEQLRSLQPDIIVVVAFRILPEDIFSIPSKGIFNLHASLLPRYRGAAPIQWALIRGEKETGVTTFLLAKKVDTGGILLQDRVSVGANETAGDLHDRLAVVGASAVSRTVKLLEKGPPQPARQDDSLATFARKITKEDRRIEWTLSSHEVHNRIRAFSPHPGSWTGIEGKMLKIFRSKIVDSQGDEPPGTVVEVARDMCVIRTGDGGIALLEVMVEGRKRMNISEFLRGYDLQLGSMLHAPA
jgi:methionyl-tRNA formyltransferase